MRFRDLQKQYKVLIKDINNSIEQVLLDGNFISGQQVTELEEQLADYVGVKHCITCGNGTDALSLALMTWDIGPGDAVFVPDFTFFSSAEVVAFEGATPVFVDVNKRTFNMSAESLELAIQAVVKEGKLRPRAVIPVDLFGQPADYSHICTVAKKYNLLMLEDGAQGFGGKINDKQACSFGDISTTSFFPAKPLGCYGDGGAIFTNNDEWADLLKSYRIHGKGSNKYDNVRIGMNSRLDTLQAAILQVKLKAFQEFELEKVNKVADRYTKALSDLVQTPFILNDFYSSWAQYSILLKDQKDRDGLKEYLGKEEIPSMIYYPKTMSQQKAFKDMESVKIDLSIAADLSKRVLSLPLHPYMEHDEQDQIINAIYKFFDNKKTVENTCIFRVFS